MAQSSVVLDGAAVERAIARMAHEVLERLHIPPLASNTALSVVGVRTGGVWLGRRLSERLLEYAGVAISFSEVNISSFRDDRPRSAVVDAAGVDQRFPAEGGKSHISASRITSHTSEHHSPPFKPSTSRRSNLDRSPKPLDR